MTSADGFWKLVSILREAIVDALEQSTFPFSKGVVIGCRKEGSQTYCSVYVANWASFDKCDPVISFDEWFCVEANFRVESPEELEEKVIDALETAFAEDSRIDYYTKEGQTYFIWTPKWWVDSTREILERIKREVEEFIEEQEHVDEDLLEELLKEQSEYFDAALWEIGLLDDDEEGVEFWWDERYGLELAVEHTKTVLIDFLTLVLGTGYCESLCVVWRL